MNILIRRNAISGVDKVYVDGMEVQNATFRRSHALDSDSVVLELPDVEIGRIMGELRPDPEAPRYQRVVVVPRESEEKRDSLFSMLDGRGQE